MFGLGGIFTDVLKDVTFRVAPLEKKDALDKAYLLDFASMLEGEGTKSSLQAKEIIMNCY